MLEKPDLADQLISSCVQNAFGLEVERLVFLPLGADTDTAVYRLEARTGALYFLKLRKGDFAEITVTIPQFLKSQGNPAIIAPLECREPGAKARLGPYRLILYPFVAGVDGYQTALTARQWQDFGAAVRDIHEAALPPGLAALTPRESFSSRWRDMVRQYQEKILQETVQDPVAQKLAEFMRINRAEIDHLVRRAEELGRTFQNQSLEMVLCHSDLHPGNLLIGEDGVLYIVDWDNPIIAPKERDLMLVGGCFTWREKQLTDQFYQGYGRTDVDPQALAYYRYERIVWDIAAFCQQLLIAGDSNLGVEDREQSYRYFTSSFLPNHEIALARQADLLI